jgi:hypothetical protein
MRFVFDGGALGGLCALWLQSESGGLRVELGLACFLNKEKTGRRCCGGGGELVGMGEDGGLDRGASSDHTAGEFFGLDVGGSDDSTKALGSPVRGAVV